MTPKTTTTPKTSLSILKPSKSTKTPAPVEKIDYSARGLIKSAHRAGGVSLHHPGRLRGAKK